VACAIKGFTVFSDLIGLSTPPMELSFLLALFGVGLGFIFYGLSFLKTQIKNYAILGTMGIIFLMILITYISFGISVLYILAVSSFVTVFSSLLKSVNMTIIATILILLIGFETASSLVTLANPDLEPFYSLTYASNLITTVLNFPDPRYIEFTPPGPGNFTFRTWITPTIRAGIMMLSNYTIAFFIFAALLFKRKQL